jgi:CRP-like cAMP-binding protein
MQRKILSWIGMPEFRAFEVIRVLNIKELSNLDDKKTRTVKQRIVDYLSGYSNRVHDAHPYATLPWEVCQDGIAEGIGVTRPHATLRLNDLKEEGVVTEIMAYVEGSHRKRKVYYVNEVITYGE